MSESCEATPNLVLNAGEQDDSQCPVCSSKTLEKLHCVFMYWWDSKGWAGLWLKCSTAFGAVDWNKIGAPDLYRTLG